MALYTLTTTLLLLISMICEVSKAAPAWLRHTGCERPSTRKEWRHLSTHEKQDYLRAVKCLWSRPAKGKAYFPVQTRHDDFVALHMNATGPAATDPEQIVAGPGIHFNGVFLPWHRYLLQIYERALQNECGYNGAHPFWDWTLDNPENNGAQFNASPIFDPVNGFGGNGYNGSVPIPLSPTVSREPPFGSCLENGPFAKYQLILDYGPPAAETKLTASTGRCLQRNFFPQIADLAFSWSKDVVPLLQKRPFSNFTYYFDQDAGNTGAIPGIHGAGHAAVGGEMVNTWSSINDPLFFLHHANLDRIWNIWQKQATENLFDMGGRIFPNGTGVTTLDYIVDMGRYMAPSVPIKAVMDTLNQNGQGILCYQYESYR